MSLSLLIAQTLFFLHLCKEVGADFFFNRSSYFEMVTGALSSMPGIKMIALVFCNTAR